MTKDLLIGAFEVNGPNIASQGLWAMPDHATYRYTDLDHWVNLAKMLDEGGFDFLFLADTYGYPVIDGNVPDLVVEQGVELPKNDPMLLIPAMASHTKNLNFAVTSSTTYEQPFSNARRFSTLDHITNGRIAWNIVTTSATVASDLFGHDSFTAHDKRYEIAEEFVDLSYKLFEGSWEDDAVKVDKEHRLFADPRKVHVVEHEGEHFKMRGIHNCAPSPQRTPVLFQAGASKSGQAFSGRNAEVIFLQSADRDKLKEQVANIRQNAADQGRDPRELKMIVVLSAVVGESKDAAQAQLDEYLSWVNPDASLLYYSYIIGIDLAKLDPDASMSGRSTEVGQTQLERYAGKTVKEAQADFIRKGLRDYILTGTGAEIAREIVELCEYADIDGINYGPYQAPKSYVDFIEHVIPELRKLGAVKEKPEDGLTFRERLRGRGNARLPDTHPAAQYRHNG